MPTWSLQLSKRNSKLRGARLLLSLLLSLLLISSLLLLLSLLPSFILQSSFLGFKRIVDNDVKDLLEKFQNVKLASINNKLDDMPTREENERVIEKLFSFHTSMMDRLDRMESLLRKVEHKLDGKFKNNL